MVVQKITLESFERMAGVGVASVHSRWRAGTFARAALNGCCLKQRSSTTDCFYTIHGALP